MNDTLTHIELGVVSRSATSARATAGHALALAAYTAAQRWTADDGRVFDFRRKVAELAAPTEILLPPGAPAWAAKPAELWRRVESADHKSNATPARYIVVAIPRSVPAERRAGFAVAVARPLVDAYGVAAQVDVHCPLASDGDEQPHVHILLATRPFDGGALAAKKSRDLEQAFRAKRGREMRKRIADGANAYMAAHGINARLDPTKRDDGVPPERDVSRAAVEVWKNAPDEADVFPTVIWERRQRREQRAELAALAAERAAADDAIAELAKQLQQQELHYAGQQADRRPDATDADARRDAPRDARDPRRHAENSRTSGGTRRCPPGGGPHRPDPRSIRGGADELGKPARQGRPARRAEERIAVRHPRHRPGDEELRRARRRLADADGRSESARRRLRERAAFSSNRREADEGLVRVRRRLRDIGPPGVGPAAAAVREARRRRHVAAALRRYYDTGWLPESAAVNLQRVEIDRAAGVVILYLTGGGRIRDDGSRVTLSGRPTATAIAEIVACADRNGWTTEGGGVEVFGAAEVRRGVAVELLSRRPPVRVIGLNGEDREVLADEMRRRAEQHRQASLVFLAQAERTALTAWERNPSGVGETALLTAVRDAQAALAVGDEATLERAAAGDVPGALRVAASWRHRVTQPTTEAAGRAVLDLPPGTKPGYVPPWVVVRAWKPKHEEREDGE